MMCPKCGGLIPEDGKAYWYSGRFCNCEKFINTLISECNHCYCMRKEIAGKIHKMCCMCGDRKLIDDKEY